jgi:hypothetical protein
VVGNDRRSVFLAPSSHFADFGHDDFFGFGRVEGKGVPEDVVFVEVSVGVKDETMAERFFEEFPTDEIGAGIGRRSVSGR